MAEAFEEERGKLVALPADVFPAELIAEVHVGKTPYVRFDGNDYSVPHDHAHRSLTVSASETRVRILDGVRLVCEHERSWDKGARTEDEAHVEGLAAMKRKARKGRVKDRLVRSSPSTERLFGELAQRGANIGSAVKALLRLLEQYGAERLEAAVREALERKTPEPRSVRLILEKERLEAGLAPRVAVPLPDDPRVRDVAVRPASLEGYGVLRDHDEESTTEGEEVRDEA